MTSSRFRSLRRDESPPIRAWFAGAAATAISNTLGFHAITSSAVRYRTLSRAGLTALDVASVTAIAWSALALAFTSTYALALAASPPGFWHRVFGTAAILAIMIAVRCFGKGRPIFFGRTRLTLPSSRIAMAQLLLGVAEMSCAIGALYVLLPADWAFPYSTFCAIYIGAVLLGIISHAPGGIGVFEATLLAAFGHQRSSVTLAALLMYRIIYNFGPFIVAVTALAIQEVRAAVSSRADTI